jgi:hypothetical protein
MTWGVLLLVVVAVGGLVGGAEEAATPPKIGKVKAPLSKTPKTVLEASGL